MCPPGPLSLVCIMSCPPTARTAASELPSICSYDFHHSPSRVPAASRGKSHSRATPPPTLQVPHELDGNNSASLLACKYLGHSPSALRGAAACSRGEDEATSRPAVGEEERATNMQLAHSGNKLCSLSCPPCLVLCRTGQPRKADQCDSMCHTVLSLGKRFQAQQTPSGVLFHLN